MLNLEGSNTPRRRPASHSGRPAGSAPQRPAAPGRQRPPRRKPPAPQTENRWFRAILMVITTIGICIFLAFFVLQSATDLFGLNKLDREIEVIIPEGSDLGDVTSILGRKGIVGQPFTFRIYAGLKLDGAKPYPGRYTLNSNMGYDEIIVAIKNGLTYKEEVRVTFFEGETLWDIAAKLEEKEVCDAREFMDYLRTAENEYDFMEQIPDDPLRFNRLEGYIFPDTYDFYVGENVPSVARKFLRNFHDKMTDSLLARMEEMDMTIDETVILASLIQKEAGIKDDMRMVSSVFHNRLGNEATYPKLQSDVTILYVENDIKPLVERSNQDMYDAYNTYVRDGLPVGAICNPGMNAIEAALNPSESNFYFFVTDARGDFYYAATAQQHYANVDIAMRVEGGQVHGIDTR